MAKNKTENKAPDIPEINNDMVNKACYVLILSMLKKGSNTMTITQTNFTDYQGNEYGDFTIGVMKLKTKGGIIIPIPEGRG